MGWALLESGPKYIDSGILSAGRLNLKYQDYRLKVIDLCQAWAFGALNSRKPDALVSELLPVTGFNNMSQAILAQAAVTAVQTAACHLHIPVVQVSAQTVKTRIGGSPNATKVKVRNGVLEILPELEDKKGAWVKVFDEPDAIAVGLTYLGHDIRA